MTTLLERIDAHVSAKCFTANCRKEGCVLGLKGLPRRHRLIDMDHADAPERSREERCDYLYFGDADARRWVVPLELKRGSVRASKIAAQLQTGAEVAEHLVGDDVAVSFIPIAAHGGRVHRQQVNSLARPENQVKFRGTRYRIELLKCGSALVDTLRV